MYIAEHKKLRRDQHTFLILSTIFLLIPALFRYDVGIDYSGYLYYADNIGEFQRLRDALDYRKVEDTFIILMFYSNKIFGTSQIGFSIYAFATQILMVLGIWNFRKYVQPSISLLLYLSALYWSSFNIFRQSLAIAIVFYAIKYIVLQRNLMKYFGMLAVAILFHNSAIVAVILPVYFSKRKYGKGIWFLLDYAIPITMVIFVQLFIQMTAYLPFLSKYTEAYSAYQYTTPLNMGFCVQVVIYGMYILYINTHKNTLSEMQFLFNKSYFYQMIHIILSYAVASLSRITLYFAIFYLLALSSMCGNYHIFSRKQSVYSVSVIVFAILIYWLTMKNNGYGQLPFTIRL